MIAGQPYRHMHSKFGGCPYKNSVKKSWSEIECSQQHVLYLVLPQVAHVPGRLQYRLHARCDTACFPRVKDDRKAVVPAQGRLEIWRHNDRLVLAAVKDIHAAIALQTSEKLNHVACINGSLLHRQHFEHRVIAHSDRKLATLKHTRGESLQ